jgi:hypothetical protein
MSHRHREREPSRDEARMYSRVYVKTVKGRGNLREM